VIPTLTGIHFLLTYACPAACDHCFLWGMPGRRGMTTAQVDTLLEQVASLGTVTAVCAEGGEAFLLPTVLRHFVRRAAKMGLQPSALTNAFWVSGPAQTRRRMTDLQEAGLTRIGISTDRWHRRTVPARRVDTLQEVCREIGLEAGRMETEPERVMHRGRAAVMLAPRRPLQPPHSLLQCPHENLAAPSRMHLDCYGRLHLCQGLQPGAGSLAEAIAGYVPGRHPIVSRLLAGGPWALAQAARERGFQPESGYADACHLCYRVREFLRPAYPDLLGPDEMYGGR